VRAWVQAAGIKPGTQLWRAMRKGHLQVDRMHQRTLHNVIQRRAEQMLRAHGMLASEAMIEAQKYSTNSLRRGTLTSMGKDGATHWSSSSTSAVPRRSRRRLCSATLSPATLVPRRCASWAFNKL
jgi:hypothetical protein